VIRRTAAITPKPNRCSTSRRPGCCGGEALRNGRDFSGNRSRAPDLFLGATCNPGAERFDAEVENTRRKIDAGARMLQTQAIYHADPLRRFIDAIKPDGVAILAGVIPLKSRKSGPGSTPICREWSYQTTCSTPWIRRRRRAWLANAASSSPPA
jgi:hypothetical protein